MQQNSVLFKRSSFFIDAINVLFYTDLFIYHELLERMEVSEFLRDIFEDKFPRYNTETTNELDKIVIKMASAKKNQNILLDWISEDKYKTSGIDVTIDEYVSHLYYDILTNPICDEYMQMTEFGNTIKLLSKDRQVNQMDIYIPFESELLRDTINESFSGLTGSSLSVVIGGKESYLKSHKYDSYIFEGVSDIDRYLIPILPKTSQITKEIIIPAYEYNMEESRTELDVLVEQVTFYRLKLKLVNNEYASEYGLSINTIAVPI